MTQHDPARCYDGYTLFSINGGTTTWLIEMDGKEFVERLLREHEGE